jgi:hypothetical protein
VNFEDLSIRELQAECKNRDLPTGRYRKDLVERLTEFEEETRVPQVKPVFVAQPSNAYDPQCWKENNIFKVSFRFDGRISATLHGEFVEQVNLHALASGYTPIGQVGRLLAQGSRVLYIVTVA